jgi:hypothetical protein
MKPIFIRVIDVDTIQLSILDVPPNINKKMDAIIMNQSLEWYGEVYMISMHHIHVISKDCKYYYRLINAGIQHLE